MNIHGAFAAIVTPFTADGSAVAEKPLRDLVDRIIGGGADGLIACGGTGEFVALSPEERQQVVAVTVDQAAGRVPVFAQTGGLSTAEALRHTEHAASVGATGVMVTPPYYEALSRTAAEEYFGTVASSTELPVMLYNYPNGTGLAMDTDLIVGLARAHDNIRYVKDSSADVLLLSTLVTEHADEIGTFCGEDILVDTALTIGALGLVTGSFNIMMPVYAQMVRAAREGDDATVARLTRETLPLIVCLASNPYTSAVKAGCELLGHEVGPVRAPLPSISPEGRKELERRIAALDPSYFA
ncbi:dihydrodipicolinate synthase family protein [Streptomyces malaysiensis]|uniref:Dihydrodipicolinate synthase/N-acetylneuraminate lyase n=1 Tax=Streptomyces malaysiensis TaxID=92644 RepID=A0A7X5WWG0_STRMQ|nr:dihydrodipicolinate synthase family protein [Streptomyces malaysiensis]NIY62268.1 dihydrodipicolinate synthase/N-acetylneuraminate lyase [Streptomyces malaysiensis]